MATIKHKLITGSSNGCLRLWNTENLEANLGQQILMIRKSFRIFYKN